MSYASRPPAQTAKTMSSRLLTMKVCNNLHKSPHQKVTPDQVHFQFMQRAAAAAASSPSAPSQDPQTPPAKRQKISAPSSAPAGLSDLQAVRGALKAEEDRRLEALDRVGADVGETKWVLSCVDADEANGEAARNMQVLTTGYSEIDHGGIDATYGVKGRRWFGKSNHKFQVCLLDGNIITSPSLCNFVYSNDVI